MTLTDEIDVSRGDMLVRPGNVPRIEPRFEAMVVWMAEEPLEVGKPYVFKHTTKSITGALTALRYRVDVNTLHRQEANFIAAQRNRTLRRLARASPSRMTRTAAIGRPGRSSSSIGSAIARSAPA